MKIPHPAVTSSVFESVKTIELDVQLSDELAWTWRVEIFRDTEREDHFRCHVWETELFRLTPSFPRDDQDQPAHISDDTLMVERPVPPRSFNYPHEDIIAPDAQSALEIVLSDLKSYLEQVTNQPSQP